MALPDQMSARAAATKFIESNAAPDHLMAVVEFGGALQVLPALLPHAQGRIAAPQPQIRRVEIDRFEDAVFADDVAEER